MVHLKVSLINILVTSRLYKIIMFNILSRDNSFMMIANMILKILVYIE
jgi:hypothetical protein